MATPERRPTALHLEAIQPVPQQLNRHGHLHRNGLLPLHIIPGSHGSTPRILLLVLQVVPVADVAEVETEDGTGNEGEA